MLLQSRLMLLGSYGHIDSEKHNHGYTHHILTLTPPRRVSHSGCHRHAKLRYRLSASDAIDHTSLRSQMGRPRARGLQSLTHP